MTSLLEKAEQYEHQNCWKEAVGIYEMMLQESPESFFLLKRLAIILNAQSQQERALEMIVRHFNQVRGEEKKSN